jgi:N-acetylated-alpha-linked acidic dipeptidase
VYVNSDSNDRGYLGVGGSHTLEKFSNGVARDVEDPESKVSVWKRMQAARIAGQSGSLTAKERDETRSRPELRIDALGSGSDYTAFIDHLGVASLNVGFGGEDGSGIYHSIYDDFYWYTHFADSDFVYGRALAQTAGMAVMRLAGADLLPFDFGGLANTVGRYVDEIERFARDQREEIIERNRAIEEGAYAAVVDPRFPVRPPRKQAVPPVLDFTPLRNGQAALARAASDYDRALASFPAAPAGAALGEANARLLAVERALTLPAGLPGRPWFRHQVYAPGFYTGYGVKTLPAVRESIEQKQWKEAGSQIGRVGGVLEQAGEAIHAAAAELTRVR